MATPYLALLRGINVGGKNVISMADLRAAFEAHGYGDVRSYIQSGNVVFTTDAPADGLEDEIETMLEERAGVPVMVVVLDLAGMVRVVGAAPDGFGTEPETYHYDAMFLKSPLTAEEVMDVLDPREGVDSVWPGDGVVYFRRLSAQRTRSRMSKVVGTPEYQQMTIRNWRTTTRLLEMLREV